MEIYPYVGLVLLNVLCYGCTEDVPHVTWDEKGYLFFCLCMGRFGNQVDHFLGGLSFAKKIDRTLVIPPWRTYKNVPFTEYFKFEAISKSHRVILAEDFMKYLAPTHWPKGQRIGMCYSSTTNNYQCNMKEGNPFGPFWDGLGVDFDKTETYSFSYMDPKSWTERFPAETYPVVALKGAPAKYPIRQGDRHLQKYLQWSDNVIEAGQNYIDANFPGERFLGIHLRNGIDWQNACKHVPGRNEYMSSPQCLDPNSDDNVTMEMCYPNTELIVKSVRTVLQRYDLNVIYVSTDKNPLIAEFTKELADLKVRVFHQDPWLPQIDLYTLGQADIFIGNCVSSFTAFVTRHRDVNYQTSLYWGMVN